MNGSVIGGMTKTNYGAGKNIELYRRHMAAVSLGVHLTFAIRQASQAYWIRGFAEDVGEPDSSIAELDTKKRRPAS